MGKKPSDGHADSDDAFLPPPPAHPESAKSVANAADKAKALVAVTHTKQAQKAVAKENDGKKAPAATAGDVGGPNFSRGRRSSGDIPVLAATLEDECVFHVWIASFQTRASNAANSAV